MAAPLENLSEIRRAILLLIKQERQATIADLAGRLGVSYEAVRQQVVQMEADGWIAAQVARDDEPRVGRPTRVYVLTAAGDHLFPKEYDLLTLDLIDTIGEQMGPGALRALLAALTEKRVRAWRPRLEGKSLAERVEALRGIYLEDDPFTEVEEAGGDLLLVERNCPFLNVALERPALCSVTVASLQRLLGVRVRREERFQAGHGRCVFRVMPGHPLAEDERRFEFEPPLPEAGDGA